MRTPLDYENLEDWIEDDNLDEMTPIERAIPLLVAAGICLLIFAGMWGFFVVGATQ